MWHVEVIVGGLFLGILFILVNRLAEHRVIRRRGYGFNILFKSVLHFIALILVCTLIFHGFKVFGLITEEQIKEFRMLVSSNFILSGVLYYATIVLVLNFFVHINKKMGPGLMMDLLTGKYFNPRSEELIFLFLDMKGSTALAEKLGHNQYSKLIKDCIHELTPIIQKYTNMLETRWFYIGKRMV